jgi:hypothetical protein
MIRKITGVMAGYAIFVMTSILIITLLDIIPKMLLSDPGQERTE